MPVALAPALTRKETWQRVWLCVMWWQRVSVYQLNKRPEAGSLLLPLHYREHIWNDVTLSHVAFSGRCLIPDLASWENALWIHQPLVAWRISHFNLKGETPHVHFHAYSATPFNFCVNVCFFKHNTQFVYTSYLLCVVIVCFVFFQYEQRPLSLILRPWPCGSMTLWLV